MIVECFLDTNILLYAASRNPAHHSKKTRAIDLLGGKQFGLSAQVLQEFYANAIRKADCKMSPSVALKWIERLEEFACVAVDIALVKSAAAVSERYKLSYWDGAIIAAAEALGAPVLYTEDLNHGQVYGGVRAVNPFIESAGSFHEEQAEPFAGAG